ncbi:DNA-7-methylguanine glycosylase [Chitinophaga polysaccharea]|uniref:DNA-7-methylguanine glycosylase n=1 Tax=Chitinophaga polysaccharea TaxID=1293035 RepID=A0A561Q3L2_9BACT|nr:DNA alkylation repair protein [Chitinophaga polysaccharea]TWF44950.1 DNA-7-methylguanine glycosylase [Chitinophaga polysaccharea]
MSYLSLITQTYSTAANTNNAVAMKAYMRDQFAFLGIKTPERRQLNKALVVQHGLPDINDMPGLIKVLWELPEREYQYAAIDFLQLMHKTWTLDYLQLIEYMITHKSWWDTVDGTVSFVAGPWLRKFPSQQPAVTDKWIASNNMWLQRAAIIFQNGYKQHTNEKLLYRYIKTQLHSKEFFIQKAIGWALREYSKTNPERVRTFVNSNALAPLSRREALRRIE